VLRGFNPDPSICRVGDDYYIATSTFEWFPGVQIHHSRDLVHFRLLRRPLDSVRQLDLRGNPDSGGVWAPCLSHDGTQFYLIYTDVKTWTDGFNDSHNYLVTAPSIAGPWSDPIYLNSSGFDPSLFHDRDGRKWLVNMRWDYRPGRSHFNGIVLQEYSNESRRLVGPVHEIFAGSALGITEAPHLYRRGDLYYLMVAEGGTSYEHAVTVARATALTGPYELDPRTPMLCAFRQDTALQKTGHASLVETPRGELYLAHLLGRPLGTRARCTLGRETGLQAVHFDSTGWLRLTDGSTLAKQIVPAPELPPHPWPASPIRREFTELLLPSEFQTLRVPFDDSFASLAERRGHLRLRGGESPASRNRQSLVARRVQSHRVSFCTSIEFAPETYQQFAGLVCWYDTSHFFLLSVSSDEVVGRCLRLLACDRGKLHDPLGAVVASPGPGAIELRGDLVGEELTWSHRSAPGPWRQLPVMLDASILSDDYVNLGFTGAFVGMAAYDLSGRRCPADFAYFDYEES
jgi:xylan 1,4-beta-xylosidase